MAKTLSKTGIGNGNPVEAGHISQSIDALTGIEAYDITISGSLTLLGETIMAGTASHAITASYAENAGGTTVDTGSLFNNASLSTPNLTFTKGDGTSLNVNMSGLVVTNATNATTAFGASYSSADSTGISFPDVPDDAGKVPSGWIEITLEGTPYYIPVWVTGE
jgi:hypothetical protein